MPWGKRKVDGIDVRTGEKGCVRGAGNAAEGLVGEGAGAWHAVLIRKRTGSLRGAAADRHELRAPLVREAAREAVRYLTGADDSPADSLLCHHDSILSGCTKWDVPETCKMLHVSGTSHFVQQERALRGKGERVGEQLRGRVESPHVRRGDAERPARARRREPPLGDARHVLEAREARHPGGDVVRARMVKEPPCA